MDKYITLSEEEIKLGFVSSCVEFVAAALGRPYDEIYQRMYKANMLRDYVYRHYDVIHTQSREHVTEDLVDLLRREEAAA